MYALCTFFYILVYLNSILNVVVEYSFSHVCVPYKFHVFVKKVEHK